MSLSVAVLLTLQSALGITAITGQVVDPNGTPLVSAQVFLEPGLAGLIQDAITDESGQFRFEDVGPGPAGIFAVAPGFGFEGQHLNVTVADDIPPLRLELHRATEIRGTIRGHDDKALENARITRIGVKGAHKVGIPFSKLKLFGYVEPQSDQDGNFVVKNVPEGTLIDLKVGHSGYAQEGVADVPAGTQGLQVLLYPGVLVEGVVVARSNQDSVPQAAVLIQNAQPPHDTALVLSSLNGQFSLRLKPGVYLYQATGVGLRSPGWERLTVDGERNIEHLRVVVAGAGKIRGSVKDALSGEPIPDVRISLNTNGTRAAVARTGPNGEFVFAAGEGENVIRVDGLPGYFPPESQDVKVSILEGTVTELPGMWLKPLPAYSIVVVDESDQPVPEALVSLLRPTQFGWHVADQAGKVDLHIRNFPEQGALMGRVEHPTLPMGALFTLDKEQAGPATVQLYPLASISGQINNSRERAVSGAVVGAFYPGEGESDAILLWQTVTDEAGAYHWDAVIPGVPQRCVARQSDDVSGESNTFNVAPGTQTILEALTLEGGKSEEVLLGTVLDWATFPLQCGTLASDALRSTRPTLLFYVGVESALSVAESAGYIQQRINGGNINVVVVANGPVSCPEESAVPILSGAPTTGATTLLLDPAGTVILESAGLPPIAALQRLNK